MFLIAISLAAIFLIVHLNNEYRDEPATSFSASLQRPKYLQTTDGGQVAEVVTQEITSDQIAHIADSAFKLKNSEINKLKEAHRLEILKMSLRLKDTIIAGYTDTSRPDLASIECDSLRKLLDMAIFPPAEYRYISDSITQHGYVLQNGVSIDSLYIPFTLTGRDVIKKKGLFNLGQEYTTQVRPSNTLLQVDSMAVYQVRHRVSWWHRWGKPALAGIITGTAVHMLSR